MCILSGIALGGVSAAASFANAVAGSALLTLGTISSVNSQKEMRENSAKSAYINAQNALENASATRQEGIEASRIERLKAIQNQSYQKTQIASSNVSVDSNNAIDNLNSTLYLGELDALNIRRQSLVRAKSYENQASNYLNRANSNNNALGTISAYSKLYQGLFNGFGGNL